jgi:hypothetical protein
MKLNRRFEVLGWFLIFVALPFSGHAATTYYVDASCGGDTLAGTSAVTAWQTLGRVSNPGSYTPPVTYQAGDTVLFKRGEIWRDQGYVGGVFNNITFGAYGTGPKPVISGAQTITGWTPAGGNVWQVNMAYGPVAMTFNGTMVIYSDNSPPTAGQWSYDGTNGIVYLNSAVDPNSNTVDAALGNYGIYMSNPSYNVTFDSLEFRMTAAAGISADCDMLTVSNCTFDLGGWGIGSGGNNCRFVNNLAQNLDGNGIASYGDYCLIAGNTTCACTGTGINVGDSSTAPANNTICANVSFDNDDAGMAVFGNNHIIANNLCSQCRSTSYYYGQGILLYDSNFCRVVGNESHDNQYGISVEQYNNTSCGNFIYGNKCHHNSGCGFGIYGDNNDNNLICDNLFYANTNGMEIHNDIQNTIIINNDICENTNYGLYLECNTPSYILRNNIFYQNANSEIYAYGYSDFADHGNNCYYHTPTMGTYVFKNYNSLKQADIPGFEPSARASDPHLADPANYNFTLLPASPCIDAGTTVGAYGFDFSGRAIINQPDIGAYEYLLSPHLAALTWTNVPARAFAIGTQGNVVFQINCSAYQYDTLKSLAVENLGNAVSVVDISSLRLLYSANGNSLNAVEVGRLNVTGNSTWSITGLAHQAADNSTYFVAADIHPNAALGRTCRFFLPAGQAAFQAGGAFPPAAITNTDTQVINYNIVVMKNPEVAVGLSSAGCIRAVKGQTGVPLAQLTLNNFTDHAVSLSSLLLNVQAPNGQALLPGAVFSSINLISGTSPVATLAGPFSQGLLCNFLPALGLAPQATLSLQVQGDILRNPIENKFCLVMLDNQCLNSGQTLSQAVAGKSFPMSTSPISLWDAQLSSTFSNYPNPFQPNQGTKIGYYLPNAAQVKLTLWTLDHRLVKTLADAQQAAGMQEIPWDGRNGQGNLVRNGVYLLVIDCTYVAGGHETYTRKIAVSK